MNRTLYLASLTAALMLAACTPAAQTGERILTRLTTPEVVDWSTDGPELLRLRFSEKVGCAPDRVSVTPKLPIESVDPADDGTVAVGFSSPQEPGREYAIQGSAEDSDGNSVRFVLPFSGFNGRVPALLINEFTTQGSGKHPDLIEIYVKGDGNLAGVALFIGTKTRFTQRFVFPSTEVKRGDYLLVHTKPQGIAEEKNETSDPAASGGYDSSDSARDFWLAGGKGLAGTNGVLTLYANTAGNLLDAVFYTSRSTDSDTDYGGFGSEALRAEVREIASAGGWKTAGEDPVPEDGVPSAGSTSTRSFCRSSTSEDTDSNADWHVAAAKKASFGGVNSDDAYVPKVKE
jgi:hypothetical protein